MDDITKRMRRRELKQAIKKATIAGIVSFSAGYWVIVGMMWFLAN